LSYFIELQEIYCLYHSVHGSATSCLWRSSFAVGNGKITPLTLICNITHTTEETFAKNRHESCTESFCKYNWL